MAMQWWCVVLIFAVFISVSANAQNPTALNWKTRAKVANNPADQLVATLNSNRTAHKGTTLSDNPGLACIALEYLKAYQGKCNDVGGPKAKKPADSEIVDKFSPACEVSASSLAPITGRLIGCETKYVTPSEAFSEILIENEKSLEILYDKNHTEVGAAVSGSDGGSPYFWCVLFSSGNLNSSFAFNGGVPKVTRPGCYSGANDECSGAFDWSQTPFVWKVFVGILVVFGCVFGV